MLVVDSLLIQDLRHHAHLHVFILINLAVLVGGYGPLLLTRKSKLDRFAVFVLSGLARASGPSRASATLSRASKQSTINKTQTYYS